MQRLCILRYKKKWNEGGKKIYIKSDIYINSLSFYVALYNHFGADFKNMTLL